MNQVPLAFQCVNGYSDERGDYGDGRMGVRFVEEEKNKDCLVSCMQITWFYVVCRRKT